MRVRGINGFGPGAPVETTATVTGLATTYAGAVTGDAPELYWRLGERSGTLVADASGRGHVAAYASPADQRTVAGGLISDTGDRAVQDARASYCERLRPDPRAARRGPAAAATARSRPSSGPARPAPASSPTAASR